MKLSRITFDFRAKLFTVFLRVLEYYDGEHHFLLSPFSSEGSKLPNQHTPFLGILILTSNRVGTFDQAFKSRIQLALHYENLKKPQRRKIWCNFFTRLRDLGETAGSV